MIHAIDKPARLLMLASFCSNNFSFIFRLLHCSFHIQLNLFEKHFHTQKSYIEKLYSNRTKERERKHGRARARSTLYIDRSIEDARIAVNACNSPRVRFSIANKTKRKLANIEPKTMHIAQMHSARCTVQAHLMKIPYHLVCVQQKSKKMTL